MDHAARTLDNVCMCPLSMNYTNTLSLSLNKLIRIIQLAHAIADQLFRAEKAESN